LLSFLLVVERMFVYDWDMFALLATDDVVALDLNDLCDSELRERYIVTRREIDRAEAYAARLLVAIAGRGIPSGEGASSTPGWVQRQTGQRFRDARVSLAAGRACESMPFMAKAWSQGEISASAATTIALGRRPGHEGVYATMEHDLVRLAANAEYRGLDARIRHYQIRCNELDDKPPEDRNGLYLSQVADRWALKGDLDRLLGATIQTAIEAATDKPGEDDLRTPAQRRGDALGRICADFLDRGESPTEDGERPHITISATLESLLNGTFETTGDLALTSSQVSRLLCDSKLQVIVLDQNGHPLDVGATVYRPSRRLRRAVIFRDKGRCRYPGCDRTHGQVHHVIAFPNGKTVIVNLVFLCDFHHRIIHKPGWHATFDGTTFTVTNPDRRHIGSTST
jgi:hypothetical protein